MEVLFDKLYLDLSQSELEAFKPLQLEEYKNELTSRKAEIVRVIDSGIVQASERLAKEETELNRLWRSIAQGSGLDLNSLRRRGLDRLECERFLAFLKAERKRVFE